MTFEKFDAWYRQCAAEDLAKPRRWHVCWPRLYRSVTIFRRPALQHGPTTFHWWLPIVVHVHASRNWGVQWRGSWNIWVYTRWNFNWCLGVRSCVKLND